MKLEKQVEWLINEILTNTRGSFVLTLVYDNEENKVTAYLDGKKIATISEECSHFHWPLSSEQTAKLHEAMIRV